MPDKYFKENIKFIKKLLTTWYVKYYNYHNKQHSSSKIDYSIEFELSCGDWRSDLQKLNRFFTNSSYKVPIPLCCL